MRTPASRRRDPNEKKTLLCGGGIRANTTSTGSLRRIASNKEIVSVYGWPSRGGVIVLEDATHVDFEFLGLSTTDPPLTRNLCTLTTSSEGESKDQPKSENVNDANDSGINQSSLTIAEDEDTFCQLLLLLGAKWWDSEKRYRFVIGYAADLYPYVKEVEDGKVAEQTLRERRWVKVGWEQPAAASTKTSGFWILDRDTNWLGVHEEEAKFVPDNAAMINLAKTMQERCAVLKKMGAAYYTTLVDYQSEETFLKAWEWKREGEIGPLRKVDFRGFGRSGGGEGIVGGGVGDGGSGGDNDHSQGPQHDELENANEYV